MEPSPTTQNSQSATEHIVLVEDSPVQALQTRLILEGAGYTIHVCPNGSMALALIAEHHPDLILLDLHLPDISGQDVAKRIKQDPLLSGIPIIFLTGVFREVQDVISGLEQGADDYIDKEVEEAELIARVKASLRAKKTQRELGRLARLLLTVNKVGSQLAGLLNPITLPNSVVRLLHDNFEYPYVHLFLQDSNALVLAAATGRNAVELIEIQPRVPLDDSCVATQSANHGQLVLANADAENFLIHPFLQDVRSLAAVPLRAAGKISGVIEIASSIPNAFTANDGLVLQTLADMAGMALHNSRLYQYMEELATFDSLTGLMNRRTILHTLDDEWNRARRYKNAVSVIILDIDKFKHINDTYGHATGDRALQTLANLLRNVIRNIDLIGRLGGDEFLLVLPETDAQGAYDVAERIRTECENLVFTIEEGLRVPLSLSLGVAGWPSIPASNLNELLKAADQALYRAKENGRNRASVYVPDDKEAML